MSQQPVVELRVHGVGGSPGPSLVGCSEPTDTEVVEDQDGTVLRQRKADNDGVVLGFDWGTVNTGSKLQAPWIFFLPFTLVNAAGWMVDNPNQPGRPNEGAFLRTASRVLIFFSGLTLTATWVLWMLNALVAYVGYQIADLVFPGGTQTLTVTVFDTELLSREVNPRVAGTWAALAVTVLLIGLTVVICGRPSKRSDAAAPGDAHSVYARLLVKDRWPDIGLALHLLVALGLVAFVAGRAYDALSETHPPRELYVGDLLLGASTVQVSLIGLIAVVAFAVPWARRIPRGPVMATLVIACTVSGGFLSGTALWVIKELPSLLNVPEANTITPGKEFVFIDVYGWILVSWLVVGLGLAAWREWGKKPAPGKEGGGTPFPRWKSVTSKSVRTANVVHRFDTILFWLGVLTGVVFVVMSASHIDFNGVLPEDWVVDDDPDFDANMYRLAAWALPAFAVLVAVRARKAVGDAPTRRFIAQAWDVLCFFPRRYHPFAVRSYATRVVPALRRNIEAKVGGDNDHGTLVLSAHSQGTAITFAALDDLSNAQLERVSLVTYGSHLGTLYRRGFPQWFDETAAGSLAARLHSWDNFYRSTDPVGGPIVCPPDDGTAPTPKRRTHNHWLPDPAEATPPIVADPRDAPLEHDLEPGAALAVHSHYLKEQALKERVRELRYGDEASP